MTQADNGRLCNRCGLLFIMLGVSPLQAEDLETEMSITPVGASIPTPAGRSLRPVKNRRGGGISSFVQGDLKVCGVALAPDDWTVCDSWCRTKPKL